MNRVMNTQDESSELRRRFIQVGVNFLLLIDKGGTSFIL
jgi:hypothetical protein